MIMDADEAMIPITDEGLVRGDGAFEVIALYAGRPFAMEEHLARLQRSATNMRLPFDLELVRAEAHRLLAQAASTDGPRGAADHGHARRPATDVHRTLAAVAGAAAARVGDLRTDASSSTGSSRSPMRRTCSPTGSPESADSMRRCSSTPPDGCSSCRRARSSTSSMATCSRRRCSDHILASITRAHLLEVTEASERACTLRGAQGGGRGDGGRHLAGGRRCRRRR